MMVRTPEASTPPSEAAFAEQPQHGGHQHQPGDAVVGDGGVDVADVEGLEGVEFRAGVEALGQGVQVQARGQRPGCEGLVLLAEPKKLHRGVEGLLPGAARAGERFGHGRGAGGQADQERGRRGPVRQFANVRALPGTGNTTAVAGSRCWTISSCSCSGQVGSRTAHWRSPATAAAKCDRKAQGVGSGEDRDRCRAAGTAAAGSVAEVGPAAGAFRPRRRRCRRGAHRPNAGVC